MFIKIPFESDIEFKTNISEITKMSLEHDYNVNDGTILGNFYISGEYRVHEVSINREPFNYTLPFTVELREDIKEDTLEFNIEDFSYEVEGKTLKVNIEYSLKAEIEELFERVNEDTLESELSYIDSFLENEINSDDSNDKIEKIEEIAEEKTEENEIELVDVAPIKKEEQKVELRNNNEEQEKKDEERVSLEEEKTIMENIKENDDTFVTYHIHIVKETDTVESICAMYNVTMPLVQEYNNLENISAGDKVLIPKLDE